MYSLCVVLRTNSECFLAQELLTGSCNSGGMFTARYELNLLSTVQVNVSLAWLSGFRRRAKWSGVSLAFLKRSLSNLWTWRSGAFPYRCTVRDFRLSSWMSWPLKMAPLGCPETSVRNYRYTLRIIPVVRIIKILLLGTIIRSKKAQRSNETSGTN